MLNSQNVLTIIAAGSYSEDWPEIEVFENDVLCGVSKIQELSEVSFPINLEANQNIIRIAYTNKTEASTKVQDGVIISDQYLEIKNIRINNILLDQWILTESDYYPTYFSGFLEANSCAETKLRSQLIWHFPGNFIIQPLPNKNKFWEWYYHQRRHVYVNQMSIRDQERNEQYAGSTDPLTELITEIKTIINV